MPACDVVVVGSYPPLPGPATAAALGAVRRAWDAGFSVRVVSYRSGAASLTVPIVGPLAGRRLEQVRQHLGRPPRLVLGLQPGVPFSSPSSAHQLATAAGLAVAMRRFDHVTVLVTGDLGVTRKCFWVLARAVDCFSVATQADADRLPRHLPGGPPSRVRRTGGPVPALSSAWSRTAPAARPFPAGAGLGTVARRPPGNDPCAKGRARARRVTSSLAGRAHNTGRAAPRRHERAN